MKINIIIPYSKTKEFAKEINELVSRISDNEWICVLDYDCMFLHHNQIELMYKYIELYPETSLFLAKSNRCGSHNEQRFNKDISNNDSMLRWIKIASQQKQTFSVSEIKDHRISGYLMLFSKQTWLKHKFDESLQILHVDRTFAKSIKDNNGDIRVMNDIIVWHTYRLLNGTQNKIHLL